MNILIVTQYYYPEQFQINEVSSELVRRGHSVTVLTGLPNYPHGDIFSGYEKAYKFVELINGVRVIRCKIQPRKSGTINLVRNYLSFARVSTRKAKRIKEKFDIVFSYGLSPIISAYPAIAYAKKHKVPLLHYCLDIWPESIQSQIKNTKSAPYKAIAKISQKIYNSFDHIAVTSRPFVDYLRDVNGINESNMSYIPQHSDKSYLETDFTSQASDKVNLMYAGNLGKAQTLDVIIKAVHELRDRNDFIVHFVGDGSQKSQLEELAKELGVDDKIIFHGNQKRENMPKYYKMANALLLTLRGNNFVGNTMPGKLQAYMATGKPILGAINGSASEVIKESNCGVCAPAGDSCGLAKIMKDFIESPDKYSNCGLCGRNYFEKNFTLNIHTDQIEKLMEEMINDYNK